MPRPTDLVLLGAGHAHVEVLRRLALAPPPGARLTLIARETMTPYSGLLPSLLRGECDFEAAHVDAARLAALAGATLVAAAAEGIDLADGVVRCAGGGRVAFDWLSIDVGGAPARVGGVPVKPIGRFLDEWGRIEAALADGDNGLAVVGGGASGCELAIALAVRLRGRARITLVSRTELLPGAPGAARRAARARLAALGVAAREGVAATGHAGGALRLADGGEIPCVTAVWATGARAPSFLAESGLACDADGCAQVAATLQSRSHPAVFAAGDCASIVGAPRPKSGVWAVRAGPPLADNLRRTIAGQTLRPWRPQRSALAILGLGDGRAVAWRGGIALSGRLPFWWKDRIDRRWMRRYE